MCAILDSTVHSRVVPVSKRERVEDLAYGRAFGLWEGLRCKQVEDVNQVEG